MGKRKYFFFDYDGTLAIPHTKDIPESTREALRLLEEAGHFLALNTGRLQCNALEYIESAGFRNIVADGGYSVTVDGQLLWMRGLDMEPLKACLRKLDEMGIPWAVTCKNEPCRVTNNEKFFQLEDDYYLPTVLDPDMTIDGLTQAFKGYIPCRFADQEALLATGVLDGVPWVTFGRDTLFIEPLSKDVGIRYLMDYYGAPQEDVVVFGDGKNDISMFCPEWTSIAMENAVPELKARANYVTGPCDGDGILDACKHFGWL